MKKPNVLFITQDITPYFKESHMGKICRYLPQGIQEKSREIRTFMPRFGSVNERKNQLHEVIRLSGMNLIINDMDHPLIIKVASIQSARMQIYFIDNEDYFQRKAVFADKNNKFFKDNDERAIFYVRGVIETVKKLGWSPDIIHCHGWMSSLAALYIKRAYKNNPLFSNAKVVCSIYNDEFTDSFNKNFANKVKQEGIENEDLVHLKRCDYIGLMKTAIDFSDGIIIAEDNIHPEIMKYLKKEVDKPILEYQPIVDDSYINAYSDFYDDILVNEPVYSN